MIISRVNSLYHLRVCKRILEHLNVSTEVHVTYSPKCSKLEAEIRNIGFIGHNNNHIHNICLKGQHLSCQEISEFISSPYYYHFNAAIRRSYPISFSGDLHREKYLINNYLSFWSDKLQKTDRYLLIWDAPHIPHEYVLLFLAKKYKYKIVIISVMAGDRAFLMNEDLQVLKPKNGCLVSEVFSREFELFQNDCHDSYNVRDVTVRNSVLRDILINSLSFLKNILSKNVRYNYGYYGAFIGNHVYSKSKERHYSLQNSIYALKALRFYSSKCIKIRTHDENAINIFLPLTCKYENSVDPLWAYYDIFTIIDALNEISERNGQAIRIYIKEHPLNFIFRPHQFYPRYIETYRSLCEIDNVYFLHPDEDSFSVLKKVDVVLSGGISTLSLQCIALGIPILPIGISPFFPDIDFYRDLENFVISRGDKPKLNIYDTKLIDAYFQLENIQAGAENSEENLVKEVVFIFMGNNKSNPSSKKPPRHINRKKAEKIEANTFN